jgi:uncharacterized membrane protein
VQPAAPGKGGGGRRSGDASKAPTGDAPKGAGGAGGAGADPAKREEFRKRLENATPEEREKMREAAKKRREAQGQ